MRGLLFEIGDGGAVFGTIRCKDASKIEAVDIWVMDPRTKKVLTVHRADENPQHSREYCIGGLSPGRVDLKIVVKGKVSTVIHGIAVVSRARTRRDIFLLEGK